MGERVYRVLFPFSGLGAGALGFLRASVRLLGDDVRFESVGGIDIDADACEDFRRLTKSPALCADISALTVDDLRAFAGMESPDVVFSSAPCVGASGLLAEAKAAEPRYQALNELALTWTRTMLAAWPGDPPRLLIFENVPGITRRAAAMLCELRKLLRAAGYVLHEGSHDCGEIGGLAQHRKRWLLVARRPATVPALLYQPVKRRVRGVGEVLGELPMPGDPAAGPLHRLPRVSWLTWVRLALIPAGGDWRDLPESVALPCATRKGDAAFSNVYRVAGWDDPSAAVIGATRPGSGAGCVADPRVGDCFKGKYGVMDWTQPSRTVIAGDGNGAGFVGDPRVPRAFANAYRVVRWDDPAGVVTGGTAPGSGGGVVADPRMHDPAKHSRPFNPRVHGVVGWDAPSNTIAGGTNPGQGPYSVADPRVAGRDPKRVNFPMLVVLPFDAPAPTITGEPAPSNGRFSVADPRVAGYPHHGSLGVAGWTDPGHVVTGAAKPSSGQFSVADPRLTCEPRGNTKGPMAVVPWSEPAGTITASLQHDNGPGSVADPRIPVDWRKPPTEPVVIVALDGTWHRPMTTLELAVLQGLPATRDGQPLELTASTEAGRRRHIGNAVPVGAAEAIARQMLLTLAQADAGRWSLSSDGGDVWVRQERERR